MQKIAIYFIAAIFVEISLVTRCQPTQGVSYPEVDQSPPINPLKCETGVLAYPPPTNKGTQFCPPKDAQMYSFELANKDTQFYPPQGGTYVLPYPPPNNKDTQFYPPQDAPNYSLELGLGEKGVLTYPPPNNKDTQFYPLQDAPNYSLELGLGEKGVLTYPPPTNQVTPVYPPQANNDPQFYPPQDARMHVFELTQIKPIVPPGRQCAVRPRKTGKASKRLSGQRSCCIPFIRYCDIKNRWMKKDCDSYDWIPITIEKCDDHSPDQVIQWDRDEHTFHLAL